MDLVAILLLTLPFLPMGKQAARWGRGFRRNLVEPCICWRFLASAFWGGGAKDQVRNPIQLFSIYIYIYISTTDIEGYSF